MRALPLACCALLLGCPEKKADAPDAAAAEPPVVELTLLFTGSENGYLLPTASDDGKAKGGAAELLGQWTEKEGHCAGPLGKNGEPACKDTGVIVLSTGDNGNGAAISSVFHGEPTAELMKHMGYAASAFGNHELDFGRPQFARNRETAAMPYLAANLPPSADTDSEAPVGLQASRIIKRRGLEIAVVGLTTQRIPSTTMPGRLDGLTLVADIEAMAAIPTVAKASALVVLTDGCLHDFADLLEKHPEWKVTVAAGQQCSEAFPPNAGGAHLVYVGRHFEQYGRAKLKFRGDKLTGIEAVTVDVEGAQPEPKAQELIAGWKKKLDEALGEEIGFSKDGIDVAAPQMGAWLATALKDTFQADVGLVNAKGARQALPKGPLTKASVYDLIPFENSVVVLKVPGEVLKQELKNPEARFAGLKSAKAVDAKKTYTVATNNFVFFGGDGFGLREVDPAPKFTGEPWQSAVIEWTKKQATSDKKPLEGLLK